MLPTVEEWLNLALRWAHVIAAIMWIGDSFLFMWLDSHLEAPRRTREGAVVGELWMTHSGGFYEVVKRRSLRPEEMPPRLYWFKWESYTTWITGFFLITVVYYLGGQAMLVEPGGPLLHAEGVALSITLLGAGVLVYDLLCRTPLVNNLKVFGIVALVAVVALTWALHGVFTPRAVFLQVGAMIATIMSSNVLLRIIPAQRHMLAATRAGTPVDTSYGARAKLHSTHNHYVTLPVLFTMLSNHFPSIYASAQPWFALGLLAVVGAGVKLFMNQRLTMHPVKLVGTAAALVTVVLLTLPRGSGVAEASYAGVPRVSYDEVHAVLQARCATCHAQVPSNPAFPAAPMGVVLETPEQIHASKDRILARVVHTRTMPLGNLTGMTEEERSLVGAWVAQGGSVSAVRAPNANAGATATTPPADAGAASPSFVTAAPTGPSLPALPSQNPAVAAPSPVASEPVQPEAEAKTVYRVRCSMCHGPSGQGDGPAAVAYKPPPRKFSDASWQTSISDQAIRKVIVSGGPAIGKSPNMPAHADLEGKPEVLSELVKLIRGFKR